MLLVVQLIFSFNKLLSILQCVLLVSSSLKREKKRERERQTKKHRILVGILVVSLKTLPFQMLAQFHADETVKNLFLVQRKT